MDFLGSVYLLASFWLEKTRSLYISRHKKYCFLLTALGKNEIAAVLTFISSRMLKAVVIIADIITGFSF